MMTRVNYHLILRLFTLLVLVSFLAACASPQRRPIEDRQNNGWNIVNDVKKLIGAPYQYGGAGPDRFDCSGLVYFVYRKAGVSVPRTVKQQFSRAQPINVNDLIPGDVIFFRITGRVDHIGIYTGDGRFVHSPSSGKRALSSKLSNPYWKKHIVRGGRF